MCELDEVNRIATDADGELRVFLRVLHGIDEQFAVEDVDVEVVSAVGCEVSRL